jgi:hypothetical protein
MGKIILPSSPLVRADRVGWGRLLNGGFESSFTSWTTAQGNGSVAIETSLVYKGTKAAKITAGATPNGSYFAQYFTCTPGEVFNWTFYTRGDGTNAGRYIAVDNTHSANIFSTTSTGVTGTSYTLVTKQFTIPADCVSAYIKCWAANVQGAIAYFDNMCLLRA